VKTADRAWIVMGAGILAYDLVADETLSQRCDHYLQRWPIASRAVILTVGLHLLNALPARVDILSVALSTLRAKGRRVPC